VALLFFSASALGEARSAARQGKEIDAAASVVAKSIGDALLNALARMASMPVRAVAAIGSAVANALLAPFGLVRELVIKIGQAGGVTVNGLRALFANIISSPGMFVNALTSSLLSVRGSASHVLGASVSFISSLPRVILTQMRIGLSALGGNIVGVTASTGRMIYSSAAMHTKAILGILGESLAAGAVRFSTSFDIILKNVAVQGKWQLSRLNDTTEQMIAEIIVAISKLLGRNQTGKSV